VNVSVSGFGYSNSGPVTGQGFEILSDATGVVAVQGQGSLPGVNGGTANVQVAVSKNLYWTFGTIAVQDASAGINLAGYRVFGAPVAKFGNSATVSGSWFLFNWRTGYKPYTITATVTDNT
jgi:hypothetical protein